MRCFGRSSGPILVMRASLLIGKSRAPSCALRLSRSSRLTAQPWLTISSRMRAQTPASSSADR
eukprot:8168005-Alexandrium_andersonii.AAC.1